MPWAGPGSYRRGRPVRLKLGINLGDLEYTIKIGLPTPTQAAPDKTEPLVKEETLTHRGGGRPIVLMKREGPSVWLRDEDGRPTVHGNILLPSETALSGFQDAARYL